jgi:hypothetical protein
MRDLAVVFAADALPMSAALPQLTAPALLADLNTQDLGAAIQVRLGAACSHRANAASAHPLSSS